MIYRVFQVFNITTKYYNASNNFSAPIKREPKPYSPRYYATEVITPEAHTENTKKEEAQNIEVVPKKDTSVRELSLKTDDLLLIGLIILLLPNAKDNLLLILVLGYLLVAGMN